MTEHRHRPGIDRPAHVPMSDEVRERLLADTSDFAGTPMGDVVRYAASVDAEAPSGEHLCGHCHTWFRRSQQGGDDRGQGSRYCSRACYLDAMRARSEATARRRRLTADVRAEVDLIESALAAQSGPVTRSPRP